MPYAVNNNRFGGSQLLPEEMKSSQTTIVMSISAFGHHGMASESFLAPTW